MMVTLYATFNGNEITASFSVPATIADYGVPGLPQFHDFDPADIEVDGLEIWGVEIDFKTLPKPVQDVILSLADEVEFD